MRRRAFIALLGSAAICPVNAQAQPAAHVSQIGVLMALGEDDKYGQSLVAAFREKLRAFGWEDGRNVNFIYRWGSGDISKMRHNASELAKLQPNVVLAVATFQVAATKEILESIPLVFVQVTDPVGAGFVRSMAHPGGNMTGFTSFEYPIGGKWLELLKEVQPTISHVVVIENPDNENRAGYVTAISAAAAKFHVQVTLVDVRNNDDIERAFASLSKEQSVGLIVPPDPATLQLRQSITSLAARYKFPSIYAFIPFVVDGGLMAYAVDNKDMYERAAIYVDRILRGEKPRDLPVQASDKFELWINLKAARAIDLTVPPPVLARADKVIE